MNLGDLLQAAAIRTPQKTALVFANESLSYETLDQSATLLARWFLQEGLVPGDRVAIHWSNAFPDRPTFLCLLPRGIDRGPDQHEAEGVRNRLHPGTFQGADVLQSARV